MDIMNKEQVAQARKEARKRWKRILEAQDLEWIEVYRERGMSISEAVDHLFYDSRRIPWVDPFSVPPLSEAA